MSDRYRVQIALTQIVDVVVVADSPEEAEERALQGEGKYGDTRAKEPETTSVVQLDG